MLHCFPSSHLDWVPRSPSMGKCFMTAVGRSVYSYLTIVHMAGASRAFLILDTWRITIYVCKFKQKLHCVSSLVTQISLALETEAMRTRPLFFCVSVSSSETQGRHGREVLWCVLLSYPFLPVGKSSIDRVHLYFCVCIIF